MKYILTELVYVFKSLDKSTIKWLILMVVGTVLVSIMMVKTIDNPVIERWRDNREENQLLRERQQLRDNYIQEDEGEDEGEETEEDPVF